MSNRFFIIVLILIVGFFGFVVITRDSDSSSQQQASAEPTNHTLGAGTSGVTLTEYGDFQCPACAAFHPLVKQVKAEYGDEITFQFRHFPLVQIHPNAMQASKAAEAASNQDKFFEMHDLLYQNQNSWSSASDPTETFVAYAQQLNLNIDQFRADMASAEVNAKILADIEQANRLGATSTPTFAINGQKLDQNPGGLEDFKRVIDEAIAKQQQ